MTMSIGVMRSKLKMLLVTFCLAIMFMSRFSVHAINPLKDPTRCGIPTCDIDNENEKFRYLSNVVYKYLYESSFHTMFDGTDSNDPASELHISALLELSFPSKCQGVLRVTSAQLKYKNVTVISDQKETATDFEYYEEEVTDEESIRNVESSEGHNENVLHPRSSEFSKDVEKFSIRFDFRDGLIQEICPDNDEQIWVMNFKRGILSALQNTMYRLDLDHKSNEIDVSGKCDVKYEFTGASNTSIMIEKTKDIASCQNSNKFKSIIQTTPYEFRKKGISWWPIYNATSYCQLSVDNFIYNNIECRETHVLIPFSNEYNGAVSKSFMRMKLIGELNETRYEDAYIETRRPLLYDHSTSPRPVHNDIKLSREHLRQMCFLGFPNIQREFPDKFVKFLSATKQLSEKGLSQLLARAGGICQNGRKHVLESLPYIESPASVEIMKDLLTGKIRSKELTPEMKEAWMTSMFYLPRPEQKTVETMFSLIQYYEIEPDPMYILIPSAVVHTYCKNHHNCFETYVIQNIVKYLEGIVTKNIAGDLKNKEKFKKVVVAMKGLGNIGIFSSDLANEMKSIIIDESYEDDVKLQAIQMFRKLNCDQTREYFKDIYQNFTQSVEVRIASYLQMMKCPSYLTIKNVKQFLKYEEKVNQVGSFVWSHLMNVAKTSSPQKIELQALLVDEDHIDDHFKKDFRKFSKNYERSLFFDEYNLGVSGESNVIFGIESYIPRSFSFNGTVNLFGGSMNPFEFNIRLQGLEKYIESIFGIDAPLNFDKLVKNFKFIYDKIKNFVEIDDDIIGAILRTRRSADNSLTEFAYRPNYEFNKPTGYFEHKIFGNDINFYDFEGLDQLSSLIKKLVPIERVKNIFSKNQEVFIDSGTFVDVAYAVPSSTGFPLIINGFGAYSLDISYFASINNKNIWETKTLDFTGKLRPSLSVELNANMQMDLFYGTTEVKVKSNVYSNYALEANLNIKDYTHASLKLKVPQDRNDIISIRTELISKIEGTDSFLNGINNRFLNTSCTWPTIHDTLGLKICVDYSLPDVSNHSRNYPSMILSGPVTFDIHLDKGDLTAKLFTLDYNWKHGKDQSEASMIFETPNTIIPRKLSAILLMKPTDYNFTMRLVNGKNIQTFLGLVKNTPELRSLDFSISKNEEKHLQLEMSLEREIESKSRRKLIPQFLLTIKGQKLAGIRGIIEVLDKSDVRQYDFELNCETKKLQSGATGTLTLTDVSARLNSKILYKFAGQKQETVDLMLELANRSQRLTEYIASLKFESSAYSNFNFYSNSSFISSMGHAELRVDYNNAPDFENPAHTLTTKITLARNTDQKSDTTFSIEVARPISNIDLKFYVKYDQHYKNGTEHTVVLLTRYSTNKEVVAKTSIFIPKGQLFGFDATALLTVPDFGTCSASIKVQEKLQRNYLIDLQGEWFGNEKIKFVGNYQDRTSSVKQFYKMKAIVSSNQFSDVNLLLSYSRDMREMKINVKTEYNNANYSFSLESTEPEPLVLIFKTELNWAERKFFIHSNSSSKNLGRTKIEIHLDRLRDIHIETWGLAKTFSKEAGIELKWDANRDPTQKFISSYKVDQPQKGIYVGNVLISYPSRTINGDILISNNGPYTGKMKISWSADEIVEISYSSGAEFKDYRKLWAEFKVNTPLAGWKNNLINGTIYQHGNLFSASLATIWAEDQNIALIFFNDYLLSDKEISCELRASVESTLNDIPVIDANFKYNQTNDNLYTNILFKHKNLKNNTDYQTFSMKSVWKRQYDSDYKNVSGSMWFISPYVNYTSGALVTKFSLTKDKTMFGVIDIDIDSRKYYFSLEGYLRKFFDNMMSFNVSTTINTFPYVMGKFGIIEHKKYIIADLKASNKSLGIELLFDFESITNFDMRFYAATPQPSLEKILAIGKIKDDVMHLEGAWNKVALGFKRVSHFKAASDFEYSYQIFTPLQHFEQNGFVLKFIAQTIQSFDVEASFKLGKHKLGVKAFGEPKKQLITQLGLQKATYIREDIAQSDELNSDEVEEAAVDIDLENFYSLAGNFEICTIIWAPITGSYDVQQVNETYHSEATIYIPKGIVTVANKLVIKSSTDFMNRLKIETPIVDYQTVNSIFKIKIQNDNAITARFDVGIKSKSKRKNYGFKLNYALPKSSKSRVHDVSLIILYPLLNTSRIDVNTRLELSKSGSRRANFTLDGFNTKLDMSGFFKKNDKNFDSGFHIRLDSPVIKDYIFNSYLQKTTILNDNQINGGFLYVDDGNENRFDTDLFYRLDSSHVIDGYLSVTTNIFPVEKFNTSVFISEGVKPKFDIQIQYGRVYELMNQIKFSINKDGSMFEGEAMTPFEELKYISFKGDLIEDSQPGAYKTKGRVYKNTIPYDFEGDVMLQRNFPHQADLVFKRDKVYSKLNYIITTDDFKRSIKANLTQNTQFMNFESELYIQDLLDWAYNVKVISSRKEINEIMLSTSLSPLPKNLYEASFEMTSPWNDYLIDKINVSSMVSLNPNDGSAKVFYVVSKHSGYNEYSWKWIEKQAKQEYDFRALMTSNDTNKHFNTQFSYINPQKSPADVSFLININSLWKLSSTAKFNLIEDPTTKLQDMSLIYDLSLPKPVESSHKIEARYKGNNFPPQFKEKSNSDWSINYSNQDMNAKMKVKGQIDTYTNMNNQINLEWGSSNVKNKIGSDFTVSEKSDKIFYKWELATPSYKDEKTIILNANYATQDKFKVIHTDVNYPESKLVTTADVAFHDMQNTKGAINTSLPIFNVTWFNVNFDFDAQEGESSKFIGATWPDNQASIDSKSTYVDSGSYKEWKGTIKAEIPLQTKHNIQIIYGLEEKPLITTGDAIVEYNTRTVLNSHYTCKTEKISDKHNKEIIDLSLENEKRPLGIHYTHETNKEPSNKFDYSMKRLEFFDLSKDTNSSRFNITSEFIVEIQDNAQKYKLIAIHPNRTITWTSDYTSTDASTQQSSKIELSESIWLEYDFSLLNMIAQDTEGQEVNIALLYPGRKISGRGNYEIKSDSVNTNVNLQWNKKDNNNVSNADEENNEDEETLDIKTVEGSFQWKDHSTAASENNHQSVKFALKHPKFEKDVTVHGSYFKDSKILGKLEIDVDYANDESHHAKFISVIKNQTDAVGYKNYTIYVNGDHAASEFQLLLDGSMGLLQNIYKTEANGNYKRGFLPEMDLEFLSFIDFSKKEMKFYRHTPNKDIDIYTIVKPQHPKYSIDGVYKDSPEYDMAGNLILDISKKTINSDVKLSEDETQKFQVRGIIPDTRSVTLNVWRDYDDIRIDDLSYFVQMNHSRLITSRLLWRPKMKKEIKTNFKNFMISRYLAIAEELEYWVKTYYTETKDVITSIMSETDQYLIPFREDLAALKDIDEDLLSFKAFLNESYYNDDFYVKSLMNYTFTVLDELAITNHITDIPKIFREMWEALGESSDAFKKSIFWIINLMKTSYKDTVETFNRLIHGNFSDYVTQFLNNIIENYDRFVKNLHITFMNSIEAMWDNMAEALSSYWNRILESIEPQILRSIHYVETTLWTISAEVFDFMYNRTNEFMESPYFMKVSNITHDLDVLYQDIQNNDMFTNFKKYSTLLYKFLKEKILRVMPFGKELRIISEDISVAYKEIKQIEFIKEHFDRLDEMQANIQWFINEFQVEKRLGVLFEILKKKLNRITQNALETEDVYREAKTKFIFDPNSGKLEWEQKLPVAWHAFNETPQFEEIPEYKFFLDVQDFLFSSKNISFSTYYGLFLSEPQSFIPPFKSHALIIGSRHIVTFDSTNLEMESGEYAGVIENSQTLSDQCSYLLAQDFIDHKFSMILKPTIVTDSDQSYLSKSLMIQSSTSKLEIELGNPAGKIRVGDHVMAVLPKDTGDMLVKRDHDVVTVKSKTGFTVVCNLEFDVCVIELSGWYFGKIGGILGTMNNEKYDDMMTSENYITENQGEFIASWKTKRNCNSMETLQVANTSFFEEELEEKCKIFFKQKTSYISSCFSVVDPTPFYDMCLHLSTLPRFKSSSINVEKAACTSVISYIEACLIQNIPLRIPDACIYCSLPNNTHVNEGSFVKFDDPNLKQIADIVFLAEAKECNTEIFKRNMLRPLLNSLTTEFKHSSIDDVKFALMSFGGSNEFTHPESITYNGEVFTGAKDIYSYFEHIKPGNQTGSDVLTALTKASKLVYRPTALKIIVLSLCGSCDMDLLKFDFKSIGQLLRENDITLHILTNQAFNTNRAFGIDKYKAFAKNDQTALTGNEKLRKNVKTPKAISECESLTFETDGSIFSSGSRTSQNELKSLMNVFAKRIANVTTITCHSCECEGHNSGAAYLTCVSCENERGGNSESNDDYDLDDDDDLDDSS